MRAVTNASRNARAACAPVRSIRATVPMEAQTRTIVSTLAALTVFAAVSV
jgi:hypothetical protein